MLYVLARRLFSFSASRDDLIVALSAAFAILSNSSNFDFVVGILAGLDENLIFCGPAECSFSFGALFNRPKYFETISLCTSPLYWITVRVMLEARWSCPTILHIDGDYLPAETG